MRSIWKAGFIIVTAILISCAKAPVSKIDLLYRGLQESFPPFDPSILTGRVILIDPGHGGHFRGTMGPESLEEAEVNLGVALYLGGLLKESGAGIHFTRWADRDFLSASDSSVAFDLARRIALIDSLQPDIFISIHHNAQSERKPEANAVETYYRLGDPASRDLAFAVHRHLMRNLGIKKGEVRQGNYFILRSISVPAILGEASYLTNPSVEKKLRLSEKQRLEAEAYFLGILDYFRRGTPRLTVISPGDSTLHEVPGMVFSVKDVGGVGIDPNAVFLSINGARVPALYNGRRGIISYDLPWNAPNGDYLTTLYVRNVMGNSSPVSRVKFTLDFPPERSVLSSVPPSIPPEGGTIRARILLLDKRGLPIRSGARTRIKTSHGSAPSHATVADGYLDFPITLDAPAGSLDIYLEVGGRSFKHTLEPGKSRQAAMRKMTIVDALTAAPVTNVTIEIGDSLFQDRSSSGHHYIPSAAGGKMIVKARGYKPVYMEKSPPDTVAMTPWFNGALAGRRFLIHPRGAIPPEFGSGKFGLSSSHVNLQVAQYLSSFIELAGGSALLTRNSEETPMPQDIVRMANLFHAGRFIEIRHSTYPFARDSTEGYVRTYYYPGSTKGAAMAEKVARSFAEVCNLPFLWVEEKVTYNLQQTSCPAIIIEAPSVKDVSEELKLDEPWYLREQAYAIFIGILRHYGVSEEGIIDVEIESPGEQTGWVITLDDTWNLLASPQAKASFYACSGGYHLISASRDTISIRSELDMRPGEKKRLSINPRDFPR